jgi:hypothetical protein
MRLLACPQSTARASRRVESPLLKQSPNPWVFSRSWFLPRRPLLTGRIGANPNERTLLIWGMEGLIYLSVVTVALMAVFRLNP